MTVQNYEWEIGIASSRAPRNDAEVRLIYDYMKLVSHLGGWGVEKYTKCIIYFPYTPLLEPERFLLRKKS
jgi:hypothetical protein